MANFAERIKDLRIKHGMTQTAMEEIIGTKQDSVSTYERGKNYPEVRNLMILADYFGVSIDYLVGRTDNPEVNR
ncbi:MAG: helix-turn-helix transcriptional regulator [Oscillospiraceae bacterium]|jgi:transcriptional regulator with XRE-family HTH domain|nr:helix-turn-helix transcriptional regulator [Oscillospiraceae bacterium]